MCHHHRHDRDCSRRHYPWHRHWCSRRLFLLSFFFSSSSSFFSFPRLLVFLVLLLIVVVVIVIVVIIIIIVATITIIVGLITAVVIIIYSHSLGAIVCSLTPSRSFTQFFLAVPLSILYFQQTPLLDSSYIHKWIYRYVVILESSQVSRLFLVISLRISWVEVGSSALVCPTTPGIWDLCWSIRDNPSEFGDFENSLRKRRRHVSITLFIVIFPIIGVPGEPIPVSSEQEIFEIIGMDYKEPSERNLWNAFPCKNNRTSLFYSLAINFVSWYSRKLVPRAFPSQFLREKPWEQGWVLKLLKLLYGTKVFTHF